MEILPVTVNDAEEILEIYAPYVENTAISFEYEVPSLEEFTERIKTITEKYPYYKAVENGKIVGYAYANTFKGRKAYDWSVETTIYMNPEYHRHGIGHMLYKKLEESLVKIGVTNMNACICSPKGFDAHGSTASIHFHEKMGFTLVGTFHDSGYKFDTWYDMIWMEKTILEHTEKQPSVKFGQWK